MLLRGVGGAFPGSVRNLQFSTVLQDGIGGDEELSFDVPARVWNEGDAQKGDMALIYDGGIEALWAGRVVETNKAYRPGAESIHVVAKGNWQEYMNRLTAAYSLAVESSVTMMVDDCIRKQFPRVLDGNNLDTIDYQTANVGVQSVAQYSQYYGDVIKKMIGYGDSATIPLPLALQANGWEDMMHGLWMRPGFERAQQPPGIGVSKAGAGGNVTFGVGGTNCFIRSVADADAAIIYDNTMIQRSTYFRDSMFRYTQRFKCDGISGLAQCLMVVTKATAPTVAASGVINTSMVYNLRQDNLGRFWLIYRTDAGVDWYWDAGTSAWRAGIWLSYAGVQGTWYTLTFEMNNDTGINFSLWDSAGTTLLFAPTVVPWTTWVTKNTDQLWATAGEPYTDIYYADLTIDYVHVYRHSLGSRVRMFSVDVSDFDYEVYLGEINQFDLSNPDEDMANYIVVSYGSPITYRPAVSDADSIERYGQIEKLIGAGENVDVTGAARIEVRALQESKDVVWRGSEIAVQGLIRRKGGAMMPAYRLRAGDRVKVSGVNFPDGFIFVVGRTSYNVESGELRISPLNMPDSIEMLLSRV